MGKMELKKDFFVDGWVRAETRGVLRGPRGPRLMDDMVANMRADF